MTNLEKKYFLFPAWVWLFGFLAWFSAEIVNVSTYLGKIDFLGTVVFSLSYYLVQVAIAADIISRKKLSFSGIFLLGLIYGILEEVFYIKNPLFLSALLALGHAAVTITFSYLLVNILNNQEKKPFLSKKGYILAGSYLLVLYIFMAQFMPFAYFDSLLVGLASLLILLFLFMKKTGKTSEEIGASDGLMKKERILIVAVAVLLLFLSRQTYVSIMILLAWFLIKRKRLNSQDLYFFAGSFIIFHLLAAILNKDIPLWKLTTNYPIVFIVGLVLIYFLWQKAKKNEPILIKAGL